MPRKHPRFSHRDKFSSYMQSALELIDPPAAGHKALDVAAGSGHMGDALADMGYQVTYADFNDERPNYVFADLNQTLPFDNDTFDLVVCLEGIEHILDPFHLLGELARVVKPGGQLILSTPNIMNLYSRCCFLLTGTFYHHAPKSAVRLCPGQRKDPGHITPLTYHQLRYLAQHFDLQITDVRTDRFKKKFLMPLWLIIYPLGRWWARKLILTKPDREDAASLQRSYQHSFSPAILFGRTMIVSMRKSD